MDQTNSVSVNLAVDVTYTFYDVPLNRPLRAIQNTTGGDMYIKLGGGDGEIKIPDGGYFEPFISMINDFEHKADVAGPAVLVF